MQSGNGLATAPRRLSRSCDSVLSTSMGCKGSRVRIPPSRPMNSIGSSDELLTHFSLGLGHSAGRTLRKARRPAASARTRERGPARSLDCARGPKSSTPRRHHEEARHLPSLELDRRVREPGPFALPAIQLDLSASRIAPAFPDLRECRCGQVPSPPPQCSSC